MKPILIFICLALLSGCYRHRQQVANNAATIYEAAEALQRGAPVSQLAPMIQRKASAIALAQGATYPSQTEGK